MAGIVGAGGNAGAVAFGFLFRAEGLSTQNALMFIGVAVVLASVTVFGVRFARETEREETMVLDRALADRAAIPPTALAAAD